MKRTNNFFKIITLFSVVFFISCQKNDSIVPGDSGQRLGGVGPTIPPISTGLSIPLAGNAFITTAATNGTESITSNGLENWTSPTAVISTFFRIGVTGLLDVKINAKVNSGSSTIKVTINGTPYTVAVAGNVIKSYTVATVNITKVGYVKVDIQGVSKTGSNYADVMDFVIDGAAALVNVTYANNAATYNASRKGPVVQLQYTTPANANIEWFYSELAIPYNGERIGTIFNANVFTGGSVGIELTAAGEKRISFSLQNPTVGAISLNRKGIDVIHASTTTGVYSYVNYNWSNLTNYKFLTQAKPDGSGNTIYTCWFYAPETSEWKLISSCRKTNTNSYLKNISSSIESTTIENSFLQRKARYFNEWITDANGTWTELTQAKFVGDAIAQNKQRLDYSASVDLGSFFLSSNGFFSDYTVLQSVLNKPSSGSQPSVDFNSLP
ncbi:MAG TPA: DUF5077 domain-containing protein [Chitinophagales bacterium]|nr:DUF5077 domain-containing protein [Chitinophagales bacterium]